MSTIDFLIKQFPLDIQQYLIDGDYEKVFYCFMGEIEDEKLGYLISTYAGRVDMIEAHQMAAEIFEHHFNWVNGAFEIAYYHQKRIAELNDYNNFEDLAQLKLCLTHPDYLEILSSEETEWIERRWKELWLKEPFE